ncbi:MAG: class I SAM-dependent methyltransferase [Pseudobacteriovorax sp.]|nr:class I SAM-dependent methyltransferase [Pseudobacteriovorax sp.]
MNQQSSSASWSHHAKTYRMIAAPCTGFLGQSLFLATAGQLPRKARILEIACGNGELSSAAALHFQDELDRLGSCGHLVATDISTEMLAHTKQRLTSLTAQSVFTCETQDGTSLTYETASFDAVYSAFGIFLFPDRNAGWREAARVLRPGGIFATAVWRGPEYNELARQQMAPLMEALPERIRNSIPKPSWATITTEEGLIAEISEFGFEGIEVSVMNAPLTAPTPLSMWHMMLENPVSKPVFDELDPEELDTVQTTVLEKFSALAGGNNRPLRFDTSCHLLVARRSRA